MHTWTEQELSMASQNSCLPASSVRSRGLTLYDTCGTSSPVVNGSKPSARNRTPASAAMALTCQQAITVLCASRTAYPDPDKVLKAGRTGYTP